MLTVSNISDGITQVAFYVQVNAANTLLGYGNGLTGFRTPFS
jgi:hypothetical protein